MGSTSKVSAGDGGAVLEDVPHLTDWLPDLPTYENPLKHNPAYAAVRQYFIEDTDVVAKDVVVNINTAGDGVHFRRAGPRDKIYFQSEDVKACIVTCGGLCPGINTVIREIVCGLWTQYGVREIFGIDGGYKGFYSRNTISLNPKVVSDIHKRGGTFLKSSRGGHDTKKIVDSIEDREFNQVYIIGGDGTHKGASAIHEECKKRGLKVAVAGIPKTIDNDLDVIDKSFGFDTAVEEAQRAINAAHVEAESVHNGIGLVKLMGRYSGYIALYATLASRDVDLCLIPEVPFYLLGPGGLIEYVHHRLKENGHMVIVVAEGAGQELIAESMGSFKNLNDASGNKLLLDVGLWLCQNLKEHFLKEFKEPLNLKYIDPTYMIRAVPSNASDNVYCTLLAHSAIHGAMAGYCGFTVGPVNVRHCYIPIPRVVAKSRHVNVADRMWARLAHDPLTHSLVQPHLGGILVLELDWYPLRPDKNEPLLLCIAGADGSFRLLEVQNLAGSKSSQLAKPTQWQRYRPMPLCCAALLPPPHALSLRIILQQGVQPSWLAIETTSTGEASIQRTPSQALGSRGGDLRHYLIPHNPVLGETVFAEVLLKALEPYRRAGRLLDEERVEQYAAVFKQGVATRCAFAAAQFGENSEAVFWLQLPRALALLSYGSAGPTAFWRPMRQSNSSATGENSQESEVKESYDSEVPVNESLDSGMTFINPKVAIPFTPVGVLPAAPFKLTHGCTDILPSEQSVVRLVARERIGWHEKCTGTEATQRRVHELIAIGDFESAVTLLLATPPNNPLFYMDALRAVSLASAVSTGLHELAVKVVAANMVGTDDSLSGTHLLCAVGRYQEACSQLQDAGRWVDAATLAATHLQGSDHARVLERWAHYVLNTEHNLWRAMILFVAAGELVEALATLRNTKQPDTAAMFLLACHEAKVSAKASLQDLKEPEVLIGDDSFDLPGDLALHHDDVQAVCEYFGEYQRHLAHACTGIGAVMD